MLNACHHTKLNNTTNVLLGIFQNTQKIYFQQEIWSSASDTFKAYKNMDIENISTMQFVAIDKHLFKFGIVENRKTLLKVEVFPLEFTFSQFLYSHQN